VHRNEAPVRIALIHALEESIAPARAAFAERWPDAYCFDLLDTSLAVDLAIRGLLDKEIATRIRVLAEYAMSSSGMAGRTAAILFTCSAFGEAIEAVKAQTVLPVLRPNEAAFEEALKYGCRLGLVTSFEPSLASLREELCLAAAACGVEISIHTALAGGALTALKRGDAAGHDRLIADAAASLDPVDAVILGQFSMARARATVERRLQLPVITTPHSAVDALRRLVAAPNATPEVN
jgi:Asp/Glu/hydantoin racemase